MQVDVLPFASVAVHINGVVPTGKQAGALFVIVTTPQPPVVDGEGGPTINTPIALGRRIIEFKFLAEIVKRSFLGKIVNARHRGAVKFTVGLEE
jgi:hypothetical protein